MSTGVKCLIRYHVFMFVWRKGINARVFIHRVCSTKMKLTETVRHSSTYTSSTEWRYRNNIHLLKNRSPHISQERTHLLQIHFKEICLVNEKKYVWLSNICVLVEETLEVPLMCERADGHPQVMTALFLPLETQILWSKDLRIPVWYQKAVSNGSASDSATMLRKNATKFEVNTNGNAGTVKQRSSVSPNCHWNESSGCGFSILVLAKDLFRLLMKEKTKSEEQTGKFSKLPGLCGKQTCALRHPPEHCSCFSKSYTFSPTVMQSQNTVCKCRYCNCSFLNNFFKPNKNHRNDIWSNVYYLLIKNSQTGPTHVKTWGYTTIKPAQTLPSFIPHRLFLGDWN